MGGEAELTCINTPEVRCLYTFRYFVVKRAKGSVCRLVWGGRCFSWLFWQSISKAKNVPTLRVMQMEQSH